MVFDFEPKQERGAAEDMHLRQTLESCWKRKKAEVKVEIYMLGVKSDLGPCFS